MASARKGGCRLHQKRRLADTGIAADQDSRSAHKAAAGRAIQLAHAGRDARRFLDLAGKRGERYGVALLRNLAWPGANSPHGIFFDDGVPFAAAIAFSGPAAVHRTAVLADELGFRFRHSLVVSAGNLGSVPSKRNKCRIIRLTYGH